MSDKDNLGEVSTIDGPSVQVVEQQAGPEFIFCADLDPDELASLSLTGEFMLRFTPAQLRELIELVSPTLCGYEE